MANKISAKLLEQIIEGALLVSGKPISVSDIRNYFSEDDIIPHLTDIRATFKKLEKRYSARGFVLKEVASGYRFQVAESAAPFVIKQWEEKPQRYSRALLETVALIAYRQPITRGDIEDIRGVSVSSNIVRTLLEREWVRVVGHKDVPGRPALYATTSKFLDYFNLKSLTELPELSEVRDLESINPELDFGDEFQRVSSSSIEDENAEFDGDTADLIPEAEAPVDSSIEELSDAEKEEIRLAKEEANKKKALEQELAAREELQDIDRYNSAFEKMIRNPDAQSQAGVERASVGQADSQSKDDTDLPGWWLGAQQETKQPSKDETQSVGSSQVPSIQVDEAGQASKSRFAQLADRLEATVHESEQQELLKAQEDEVSVEVSLIEESPSDIEGSRSVIGGSPVKDRLDRDVGADAPLENTDAEIRLTEQSFGEPIAGNEMSETDIQELIQKKLAEQAALLNQQSSEADSEED